MIIVVEMQIPLICKFKKKIITVGEFVNPVSLCNFISGRIGFSGS